MVKILGMGPAQDLIDGIQKYPVPEMVLLRSIVSFVICFSIIKKRGLPVFGVNRKWLFIRGIFGSAALTMFFYTIDNLPIAIATTVQYLSPLFTVLFAIFILKEKVKTIQWIFFGVAFAGVVTIGLSKFIAEGNDIETINPMWVAVGFISAICSGMAYNAIVKCKETDAPVTIVFYFPLVAIPIMTIITLFDYVIPQGIEWIMLLFIGIFTQVAQVSMTRAFHSEATATITPFKYFGSIYALIVGYFLFGEILSFYSLFGIGLILIGVLANTFLRNKKEPKALSK